MCSVRALMCKQQRLVALRAICRRHEMRVRLRPLLSLRGCDGQICSCLRPTRSAHFC